MGSIFFITLVLALIVTAILPWVHLFRIGKMCDEINQLNVDVLYLLAKSKDSAAPQLITNHIVQPPSTQKVAAAIPQPAQKIQDDGFEEFEIEDEIPAAPAPQPIPVYQERPTPAAETSMEFSLGTKLPVWIGAISLICAAFFTVKYSIEAGWFGPLARTCLGALFGASLTVAGHVISNRLTMPNRERIGQGLVGAGLVSLYVSLYAAVNLYDLLPPFAGFIGMAAVTALAVLMSLRHGQPIAVFGLIGGLLTPALVGSTEPNAVALFAYLFALFIGVLSIMVRQGWWTLASLALGGMFLWTGIWFCSPTGPDDSSTLVLFVMGLCAAVIGVTHRALLDQTKQDQSPAHVLNLGALAGAALTISIFSFKLNLSLFDWSMFGVLTCAVIAMAYLRPPIYQRALLAKMALDLMIFMFWLDTASLTDTLIVLSGLVALYTLVPGVLIRSMADPRPFAQIQAVSALALFLIAHFLIKVPVELAQQGFWGMIALALTLVSVLRVRSLLLRPHRNPEVQNHLVAISSLAATSFLSFGLCLEVSSQWLPVAFAAQAAATMWILTRTQISFLKKIVLALSAIFVALSYKQIILFASLILSSLVKETVPTQLTADLMLKSGQPFGLLGLPLLLTSATLFMLYKYEGTLTTLGKFLSTVTISLFAALSYYLVRDILHPAPDFFAHPAGFIERGVITSLIAGAGLGVALGGFHKNLDLLKAFGSALVAAALARIVYFDLLLFNPYYDSSQSVGMLPLINGLTLTYGGGTLLAILGARSVLLNRGQEWLETGYRVTALALLFTFVTLTVRHAFHDTVYQSGLISNAELYTYSIVWLLTGLGLLAYGLMRDLKSIRLASLGFMLLTIGKVFLIDAGALEGLYRIASFLGLGVSLIGLSYFYTRFILKK